MANTQPPGVFNFFGLPRELRDAIFDTTTLRESRTRDIVPLKAEYTPIRNLFLVSRQFRTEYSDSCKRYAPMSIAVIGISSTRLSYEGSPVTHAYLESSVPIVPSLRKYAVSELGVCFAKASDIVSELKNARYVSFRILVGPECVASEAREEVRRKVVELATDGVISDFHMARCYGKQVVARWSLGKGNEVEFLGPLAE